MTRCARPRRLFALAMLPLLVAVPELAHACSVCTAGRGDETRFAFLITTAFMSALPLAMIGAMVWWLRRRAGAQRPLAPSPRIEPVPGRAWQAAPDPSQGPASH